tara:strand:+ start:341 stop:1372 length:1032 start_codon:yes stop_codon:yes gene_type:complete
MAYTIIDDPTVYFNTKLWNGNSSTQAITGVGFQPDFVWGKQRTGTESHQLLDVLRGANNILTSNTDAAALADSNILNSFDADGYTLGSQNQLNDTGATYVGWNWKANGAGASNEDGSINTIKTSANTTSGFSISTYTGTGANATIGHGLGVVPQVVIYKKTSATGNWFMYNENIGNTKYLNLDATSAEQTYNVFQDTTPSSTLLYVSGDSGANQNSQTYVAYCFADVQGYSKFGSYTGNNNADGPFVYTGFKPAWVLFKRSSAAENWSLYDNKRLGYNPQSYGLRPNINLAESEYATTDSVDFVSNGFKIREAGTNINDGTYIYLAFAEEPFVTSTGIPATAR